ncbi:hypothetical protein EDC01DRAFT_632854 [Geopyxis carbonaria]|nr:hypothetical protein EDC01DRAFT_632854 [Geopyxis carbonaria]
MSPYHPAATPFTTPITMSFCTGFRNCCCCAPGSCAPFLSCLTTVFCCTCCGQTTMNPTPHPGAAPSPDPRPRRKRNIHAEAAAATTTLAAAPKKHPQLSHREELAAAQAAAPKEPIPPAAPKLPLLEGYRELTSTVAPLPPLPDEIADHVEWYQRQLAGAAMRVTAWVGEGAEAEWDSQRQGRRIRLLSEVARLERLENELWVRLEEFEGTAAWRREASGRRRMMEKALRKEMVVDDS